MAHKVSTKQSGQVSCWRPLKWPTSDSRKSCNSNNKRWTWKQVAPPEESSTREASQWQESLERSIWLRPKRPPWFGNCARRVLAEGKSHWATCGLVLLLVLPRNWWKLPIWPLLKLNFTSVAVLEGNQSKRSQINGAWLAPLRDWLERLCSVVWFGSTDKWWPVEGRLILHLAALGTGERFFVECFWKTPKKSHFWRLERRCAAN